ncbi:hypothetical protein [Ammoniphilus sp. YIM 78166]|uniref:hypothetical protein n=1 Tax=Ammoniphilus sp. YIM 78166 TaxID=1644106 RepID=UPI00106F7647|nr:hypothetical protein [Ammoniphilus sp. YIM 78166]
MAVSYAHASRFVGQHVVAHCVGGRTYYGMVKSVTHDTVYLQPIGAPAGYVSHKQEKLKVKTADKPGKAETQEVYWWGPGAIALPLFVILALSLAWWI